MQRQRIKAITNLAIVIVLSIVAGTILILNIGIDTPHSVANKRSLGLYDLYSSNNGEILLAMNELDRCRDTNCVVIVARRSPMRDLQVLNSIVEDGAVVIAYGHPSYIMDLLGNLGLDVSFTGYARGGEIYSNDKYSVWVNISNIKALFRNPYVINGNIDESKIVAWSNHVLYVDLNGNGYYDLDEPIGIQPLGVEINVGKGKYVVLFTEYFLENDLLGFNQEYVRINLNDRKLLIDQSEFASDTYEYLRIMMTIRSSPRYMLVNALIIAFLALVAYNVNRR